MSDPDAFTLVLDRLGYQPAFRYEKYRTQLQAAGEPGLITIDETPIGVYLELEGPQDWIDSTAARLGFPASAVFDGQLRRALPGVSGSNIRKHPPDMIFDLDSTVHRCDKITLERPKSIE